MRQKHGQEQWENNGKSGKKHQRIQESTDIVISSAVFVFIMFPVPFFLFCVPSGQIVNLVK